MGGDYVFYNSCTLNVNRAWNDVDLEGFRKGLYAEIFLIFFTHFILQILHAFRYRKSKAKPLQEKPVQPIEPMKQYPKIEQPAQNQEEKPESQNKEPVVKQSPSEQNPNEDPRPSLPWHDRRWNKNFAYIFSSHAVGLGMVILFSPLAGGMVVAYLHLFCFILYTVSELTKKIFLVRIMRTLMDLLNLTLMIIGTVGINYNQSDSAGVCYRNII